MPVRIFRLGGEPPDDLRETTTAAQRLDILRELTKRAWTLSGQPFPSYSRRQIPVRVVRPG